MNIDKQDERLLHEILSKYKQGLISGLIQGNNVTFTSTGCRNKVISSTGGGTSALFPKGYEFISESRDFLPTDEGKLLVLAAGVTITMPSEFPFLSNQILGVFPLDSNCYYQDKAGSTVQIFGINNQPNEVVVLLSEPDFNSLIPISSSVIEGKTMLKYLYDKSQNAIPLSGTEVGSPVTGDIETTNGVRIYSNGVDSGSYSAYSLDDITAIISTNDNYTGYNSNITLNPNYVSFSSTNPASEGIVGIEDHTEYAKSNPLAYMQYAGLSSLRFVISKSASVSDADFTATPGTAYVLPEVADNDKVITLTSPVDGDIYRFNNTVQPTNNWITSILFFLSDGTSSNVVPAEKITVIQYDAAASVFHLISSQ